VQELEVGTVVEVAGDVTTRMRDRTRWAVFFPAEEANYVFCRLKKDGSPASVNAANIEGLSPEIVQRLIDGRRLSIRPEKVTF